MCAHRARLGRHHSQSHVHGHQAQEWLARAHRRGPRRPGVLDCRHLQRRVAGRTQGAHGLRPSLRAHDVQGIREGRGGRTLHARLQQRRQHERHDEQGPHALLRDDAGQPARSGAVSRSRSDAVSRDYQGQPRQSATRGTGRAPSRHRQPAVREDVRSHRRARLRQLRLRALGHRLDGRPQCGLGRGRRLVLQDLLRPQQRCDCDRRRRQGRRVLSRKSASTSSRSHRSRRRRPWT